MGTAPLPFPETLSTETAATIARCSSRTMRRWCEAYALGVKIGGTWRVLPDRLDTFLKGAWQPNAATATPDTFAA